MGRCVLIAVAGGIVTLTLVIFALVIFAPRHFDLRLQNTSAQVTLVYVGAQDCAPCRIWQSRERTAFETSTEYKRLSYREVEAPTLVDVMNDDFWPRDLRVYRNNISQEAGVPFWLVIADGEVVAKGFGLTQWNASILPKIKSLLR